MALRLKGKMPAPGQPDRRQYMIDVQHMKRRVRIGTGTRNRDAALGKQQAVLDMLRAYPSVSDIELRKAVRGAEAAADVMRRRAQGYTVRDAFERAKSDPYTWGGEKVKDKYGLKVRQSLIERAIGEDTPIASITRETLKDAGTRLAAGHHYKGGKMGKPRAGASVNRALSTLVTLMRLCKVNYPRESMVTDVPDLPRLPERGEREWIWTHEDEAELLKQVLLLDEEEDKQAGRPRVRDAHLYHRLFVVLAETGMRLGEALKLRWTDIHFDDRFISLSRKADLKTRASQRVIPMTRRCMDALRSMPQSNKSPGPFSGCRKKRAEMYWNKARQAAGFTHRDAVIHSLRHTAATRVLSTMGDIRLTQQWLGHSNIATTEKYAKIVSERMREAVDRLDSRQK